jgi:hypothetical protein
MTERILHLTLKAVYVTALFILALDLLYWIPQ